MRNTPEVNLLSVVRTYLEDPKNWKQGAFGLEEGRPSCVHGALMKLSTSPEMDAAYSRACDAIFKTLDDAGLRDSNRGLASFNDHPERKHEEIIQLLDNTILRLEAEGL